MGTSQRDARQCLCGVLLARDNSDGRCTTCRVRSRDHLITAPEVSPEFWEDQAMRAALDSCHMGQVIRAFRTHRHHAISQQTAAAWAGITQAQLSRIETGGPISQNDRLIQWAKILRIPSLYLWFKVPSGQQGDDVKRGEFLRLGTAVLAGASASVLLGGGTLPVSALTQDDCAQVLAWELWTRRRSSL